MKNETNEFSFILKPSEHGIGVFATHDIAQDTYLRLWGNQIKNDIDRARILDEKTVPEALKGYCVNRGDKLLCPNDFGLMEIGWFINHSNTPNTHQKQYKFFYAKRDIHDGEEILIDYNSLDEPEENKDAFYKATS